MRHAPLFVFLAFVFAALLLQPVGDVQNWFTPAARLLLRGENVYALNAAGPFIYPPVTLPLFMLFALPGAQAALLAVNGMAALWMLRALNASRWWLLYPPVLLALWLGTFDLPVAALAFLAYRRKSSWLMALALLIKPQTAIFWCVPFILEHPRAIWRMAFVGGGAVGLSILLMPSTWAEWLAVIRDGREFFTAYYINGSYSLFALAVGGLAFRLSQSRARALTALLLPFSRYYSGVGLIGYAGVWAIALSWVLFAAAAVTGTTVFFVEPMVVLVVSAVVETYPRKRGAHEAHLSGGLLSRRMAND